MLLESTKLMELGDPLRHGLLADRALRILSTEGKLTAEDREVLASLKKFVELSEDGSNQVTTGKLTTNAINSIDAYRMILSSLSYNSLSKETLERIVKLLSAVKDEIAVVLEKGEIEPCGY